MPNRQMKTCNTKQRARRASEKRDSMTSMDIPGLSTLYSIHKRQIDRKNDILKQRQEFAHGLLQNCQMWAQALLTAFDAAVHRWHTEGEQAAKDEIVAQEEDFMKLEYWSLESTSPVLLFLKEDDRFAPFVSSCAAFYNSALSVKRMAYGQIQDASGIFVFSDQRLVRDMVKLWRSEVERMLREVSINHMHVMTLTPR